MLPIHGVMGGGWQILSAWLSLLLLFLAAGNALAVSWVPVAWTEGRAEVYFVDSDSILQDGELRRAWVRVDYNVPQYNAQKRGYYNERIQRLAVRCGDQSYAVTSFSQRSRIGDTFDTVDSESFAREYWNFREFPPGTVGARIIAEVCKSTRATNTEVPIRRVADAIGSANWEHIFTADNRTDGPTAYEIDRRSIRKLTNSDNVVSYIRATPTQGVVKGQRYRDHVAEIYVNCTRRQWSISAYVYYSFNNAVLDQWDVPLEQMEWSKPTEGTVSEQFLSHSCTGRSQVATAPTSRDQRSSAGFGTGWLAESGYVITAHHVVDQARRITLVLKDKRRISAKVVTVDAANDIAILEADFGANRPGALPIAKGNVALGARVFTLGFPHPTLLGLSPKLTAGEISSIAGLRDDPRVMQISVPVQSGNSGGPLLNLQGEVVGVISAKLSALNVLQSTGDLTQNVNYAIKGRYVSGLLSDVRARNFQLVRPSPSAPMESVVGVVRDSIFVIVTE